MFKLQTLFLGQVTRLDIQGYIIKKNIIPSGYIIIVYVDISTINYSQY